MIEVTFQFPVGYTHFTPLVSHRRPKTKPVAVLWCAVCRAVGPSTSTYTKLKWLLPDPTQLKKHFVKFEILALLGVFG